MKAGGIGAVRMAVPWSSVQETTKKGVYDWSSVDPAIGRPRRA